MNEQLNEREVGYSSEVRTSHSNIWRSNLDLEIKNINSVRHFTSEHRIYIYLPKMTSTVGIYSWFVTLMGENKLIVFED
jgi:hypothetical protein